MRLQNLQREELPNTRNRYLNKIITVTKACCKTIGNEIWTKQTANVCELGIHKLQPN